MTPERRPSHRLFLHAIAMLALAALMAMPLSSSAGERVVIGISPDQSGTLSIIASQRGIFAKHGVDAEIRVIESGSKAVAMMLNDELDIAESTGFALVTNSFSRNDFRILDQVLTTGNSNMIIARKDRGIVKIQDLAGKKVGVLKSGFPQYAFDLMLLNAGMDPKKVNMVYAETDRLCQLLGSGTIDAAIIYGKWIDLAKDTLKENAVIFHDEKIVHVTVMHSCKLQKLTQNPNLYSNVLKAYIEAEEYVKQNNDASQKIVIDYLKLDPERAKKSWKPNLAHVSLDKSLVYDLENLAKWQIETGMQKIGKAPNYLKFIHFKTLSDIDPARVTIAH